MATTTEENPQAPSLTQPKSTFAASFAQAMNQQTDEPATQPVPEPEKPEAPPAAKPTPTTKAPEVAPAAQEESETEEKWPRSGKDWKAYKQANKEREAALKKEVEEHKARVAEYESKLKGAPSEAQLKELDEIKKERDELSKRLQIVDVTQHPKFQEYFSKRTTAQLDLAKRIVGQGNEAKIADLLTQPESAWRQQQIEDLMLELTPSQQARLGGVINSLDQIEQERQSEIKNNQANFAQLQAQKAEEAKRRQLETANLIESTIKAACDAQDGLPAYQKREGDEAWNSEVDARIAKARAILSGQGMEPKGVVQAALSAAALPAVLKDNLALRSQIAKLEAQVASLSSATPRIEQGKGETSAKPEPIKPGTRPMDLTRGWVSNFTKSMNGEQ